MTTRLVIVESRDLDSDERDRTQVSVNVPMEDARQREQLAAIVNDVHPEAKLRSFCDGAATFLGPGHLVVAYYGEPVVVESCPADSTNPQTLFAA